MNLFSIIFIISTVFGSEMQESTKTNISVSRGDFPHPAVIEGYAATIAAFPFAVRMYKFVRSASIFCTGEIVHRKLVLTAAHCVQKEGSMIVVTGDANLEDYAKARNMHKYARYRVIDTFVHPKYDTRAHVHDVAVLKLGRAVMHNGYKILPISYERLKGGPVEAVIYGWGGTEKLTRNYQLYAKNITIETCRLWPNDYEYICVIGRGIAHGDSGGAVIVDGYLRGVASFYELGIHKANSSCCLEERYFYMSLWEERDFLESTIHKNAANYNRCFLILIMVSFIFMI